MKNYRKKHLQPMYPYNPFNGIPSGCSVSEADKANGSPQKGDMIAVNPNDPTDTWLVAKQFFLDNYEEVVTASTTD